MNNKMPNHVALIPDGNRRWAKARDKNAYYGHRQGIEAFEKVAWHGFNAGVENISIWGMSVDNFLKRNKTEVMGLMSIFTNEFQRLAQSKDIHERQVKINVLGKWEEKLPTVVKKSVRRAIRSTAKYKKFQLNILLLYNGTEDMLQATQTIVNQAEKGKIKKITHKTIKKNLRTKKLPPVDLLIRTGGEPHLSNGFMMWETANAELYFTKKLWPQFTAKEFDKALNSYAERRRKLGA